MLQTFSAGFLNFVLLFLDAEELHHLRHTCKRLFEIIEYIGKEDFRELARVTNCSGWSRCATCGLLFTGNELRDHYFFFPHHRFFSSLSFCFGETIFYHRTKKDSEATFFSLEEITRVFESEAILLFTDYGYVQYTGLPRRQTILFPIPHLQFRHGQCIFILKRQMFLTFRTAGDCAEVPLILSPVRRYRILKPGNREMYISPQFWNHSGSLTCRIRKE